MPDQRRTLTTIVVVFAAMILVGVAYVSLDRDVPTGGRTTAPLPAPPTNWGPPKQTAPPGTPRSGRDYPIRQLGALTRKPVVVRGTGNADLRYARLAGNGTVAHLVCATCAGDTWLVETSRGWPLSGGPLPYPEDYTYMVDTVDVAAKNGLLVKAPASATWTLTLTPFDALSVLTSTVRGQNSMVVRVRTTQPLTLSCSDGAWAKTFTKAPGEDEYDVGTVMSQDDGGSWRISPPDGTDEMVVNVDCSQPWTLELA